MSFIFSHAKIQNSPQVITYSRVNERNNVIEAEQLVQASKAINQQNKTENTLL